MRGHRRGQPPGQFYFLFSKQPITKPDISIQNLLFGVDQVPVEAVIGANGYTRRICIPSKKLW